VTSVPQFLALLLDLLLSITASGQAAPAVRLELSLAAGKTTFRSGEPILLELAFTAMEPGYSLNTTTTNPASPVDTLVLSPTDGVFPWLDDQARGNRYSPDYAALVSLEADKPVTLSLPLNAVYRFDSPGHYIVHVVTNRLVGGENIGSQHPVAVLASNEVRFAIEPMSAEEDGARAAALERQIREATDQRHAQSLANELDWLTGDASTQVELSLFLHPKTFYPFGVSVDRGLWLARNRAMVVAALERALGDPAQPLPAGSTLLSTAIGLKARLQVPYDPAAPDKPLPTEQIESDYLKHIAATLPHRVGEPLVTSALTLFTRLARRKETAGPEFNVDWVLNAYGSYLQDTRMIPALENILQTQSKPVLNGERAAALAQLIKLGAQSVRRFVLQDICATHSITLNAVSNAPFDTLPEADECFKAQIYAPAATNTNRARVDLQQKTALAARFATKAIYDDLLALYEKSGNNLDGQARGALLAYFMRWDAHRGRPLLDAALPLTAEQFEPNILFALFSTQYSDGLEAFLRERLAVGPPPQVAAAAFELSRYGPAEDQDLLRKRLDRWRTQWSGKDIPQAEGQLEEELVMYITHGEHWQLSDVDARRLRESCVSQQCRARQTAVNTPEDPRPR
jgi:hypothetical protein